MWPGQQPPGGEQNPQDQNPYQQPGYQQPNPYQQPGYQQSPAYGTPQWGTPAAVGAPQPSTGGSGGGGGGNKTKITAIVAASAVVIAAGVTGVLVLGGDKDDEAGGGGPSKSPTSSVSKSASPTATSEDNPRNGEEEKPTIDGWKVVINPKWGTAFDVPADWAVKTPDTFIGFDDNSKDDASVIIGMTAPAYLKEEWCSVDSDKDGRMDDTALAAVGTKGQNGAKNTEDVARNDSAWWVFGGYTDQKDASKKLLKIGKPKAYKTSSGVEGSVVTTYSSGVKKQDKCDSDGKATTFAFKNSAGDFVSWTFYGAKGVNDEVPDETVQKILSTVRLYGDPTGG